MATDRMLRASMDLSSELSTWAVPWYEPFPVDGAASLMQAIVLGCTKAGQYYADPRLLWRLIWCEDDSRRPEIAGWVSALEDHGDIRVDRSALNCFGGWHAVLTVQDRRRFARWRARRAIPAKVRAAVYARDGHRCVYCGTDRSLSVDHIFAFSRGGEDSMDNFQTLCRSCNSKKGAH